MLDIFYAYAFLLKWSFIGFGGCLVICSGITFAGYLIQKHRRRKNYARMERNRHPMESNE